MEDEEDTSHSSAHEVDRIMKTTGSRKGNNELGNNSIW